MNQNCQNLYEQLRDLKQDHAAYLLAYADCEKNKDFTPLKSLKEELKNQIAALLKKINPEITFNNYIKHLDLSEDADEDRELKEKLKAMASSESYKEAVETAKELDPTIKPPAYRQIIENIKALGPEMLQKIATVMGKPELIIVSSKSLREIVAAIDRNRHYEDQVDCYLSEEYDWSNGTDKVGVSIVDMQHHPETVPGQQPDRQINDEQLHICQEYFVEQGMHLVHDYEYAVAMQRSLRAYKKAIEGGEENPGKYIIDFYGKLNKTVTIFNQKRINKFKKVAYGFFIPSGRGVRFDLSDTDNRSGNLRGRGSVQVM